jgi:hypothetical protein
VPDCVVLVEGASDYRALEVVADRLGLDLDAARVAVVVMHGITNLPRHLRELPEGVRVTGLYDGAEGRYVRATLERLGRTEHFFACERDLEEELIRALGPDRVVAVIEQAGETGPWEILQRQPFHRGRDRVDVLYRFLGTKSGRNQRYARLLTEAMTPDEIPTPLKAVLQEAVRRDRAQHR